MPILLQERSEYRIRILPEVLFLLLLLHVEALQVFLSCIHPLLLHFHLNLCRGFQKWKQEMRHMQVDVHRM